MLWKRRNGVVSRNETTSMNQFLSSCIGEAKLWKYRLQRKIGKLQTLGVIFSIRQCSCPKNFSHVMYFSN
jgi:hypothetical protein